MTEPRNLPASPRRLAKARAQGDHPISPAATSAGALLFGCASLVLLGVHGWVALLELVVGSLSQPHTIGAKPIAHWVVRLSAPILGTAAVGALAIGMLQTGARVSFHPVRFDAQRLRPRLVQREGLVPALAAAFAPLLSLLGLTWWTLSSARERLAALLEAPLDPHAISGWLFSTTQRGLWWACALAAAGGAVGWLVALRSFRRRHRMSRREQLAEQKEAEGDAEARRQRRRKHEQLSEATELWRVRDAALIVWDSTARALALQMSPVPGEPPTVTVRASGWLSTALRREAGRLGVPCQQDDSLIEALWDHEVNQPIAVSTYAAVSHAMRTAGARGKAPTRAR